MTHNAAANIIHAAAVSFLGFERPIVENVTRDDDGYWMADVDTPAGRLFAQFPEWYAGHVEFAEAA